MKSTFLMQNFLPILEKNNATLQLFFSQPIFFLFVNFTSFKNLNKISVFISYIRFFWAKQLFTLASYKFKKITYKKLNCFFFVFKTPNKCLYFKVKNTSANNTTDLLVPFSSARLLCFFIRDFNLNCFKTFFWLLQSQRALFYFIGATSFSFFLKSPLKLKAFKSFKELKVGNSLNLFLTNNSNL